MICDRGASLSGSALYWSRCWDASESKPMTEAKTLHISSPKHLNGMISWLIADYQGKLGEIWFRAKHRDRMGASLLLCPPWQADPWWGGDNNNQQVDNHHDWSSELTSFWKPRLQEFSRDFVNSSLFQEAANDIYVISDKIKIKRKASFE